MSRIFRDQFRSLLRLPGTNYITLYTSGHVTVQIIIISYRAD